MKVFIRSFIPTAHTYKSLSIAGLPIISNPDGSFEVNYPVENIEEGENILRRINNSLYDEGKIEEEDYHENLFSCKHGYIRIDGITFSVDFE